MREKISDAGAWRPTRRGALLGATLALTLVACTDGGNALDDVMDTVEQEDTGVVEGDVAVPADTRPVNPCERPDGDPIAHRLIWRGTQCYTSSARTEIVVTDAETWATVADAVNCSPVHSELVDFAHEYVVVLGAYSGATSSFSFNDELVLAGDGGPYVEVQLTDRSLGCAVHGMLATGYAVALALPRSAGEMPTTCLWVRPGCY